MLVAPAPRFIFTNNMDKGAEKLESSDSESVLMDNVLKHDGSSHSDKEVAEEGEDAHTFVEMSKDPGTDSESGSSSSIYKEKSNSGAKHADNISNSCVMPIASNVGSSNVGSSAPGAKSDLDTKLKKLISEMDDLILKLQTPTFKCIIVCSYVALIASAALNTILCTSIRSAWEFLGGPTMIFGMLTVGLGSATLVWYTAKPEPLQGFEDMPYVLSVSAWSNKIGVADIMSQILLCFGWITIGIKQISFMMGVDESYPRMTKPLAILTVFSYLGVLGSIVPITIVKILEHNIICNKKAYVNNTISI